MGKERKTSAIIGIIVAALIMFVAAALIGYNLFKKDTSSKKVEEKEETKETKKEEKKEFSYTPLTYEVCDDDSCVYILGSIHLGDKRIDKIDEKILKIFDDCDYFAEEVYDDAEIDYDMFMLKDGQTIQDLASPELYAKMQKFEEEHPMFILKSLNTFTPAYMFDYVDLLPFIESKYTREGVDNFFEKRAEKSKKEIFAFETTEEQLNILTAYSNEFYFEQIEYALDNYDEVKEDALETYEAYLSGDEERIKKAIMSEEEDEDEKLTEEELAFEEALLTKRNIHMIEVIEEYLRDNKKVFVVVGEAHVVAPIEEEGIIEALKETNNYKIRVIK